MLVGEVSDVDEMGLADILSLHGSQLERVVRVKYLGVLIRGNGEWMSHWEMFKLKAVRAASMIMRLSGVFQLVPFVVIAVIRMIVIPVLLYGAPVWCPSASGFVEAEEILVKPVRFALELRQKCSFV